MPVYINSIAAISPQDTLNPETFLEEVTYQEGFSMLCREPNYRDFIDPKYLRRMSRIVKIGVCASKVCLKNEEEGFDPDAILVGTGLGCLEDTEKFLSAIYEHEEQISSPTQFMQSTHNTVASQIAIMLGCKNYNFTYVHRGFSFESALLDATLQFAESEKEITNILVGALDEVTDTYLDVTRKLKFWKPNLHGQDFQFNSSWDHMQAGEGAAFFLLSDQSKEETFAEFKGVEMIYKPIDSAEVKHRILDFLDRMGLQPEDMDLILTGRNGSSSNDAIFDVVHDDIFKNKAQANFKHLCGEYKTASSFGFWLGAKIIKTQKIPSSVLLSEESPNKIKHLLIYNNYSNINHSLVLLSHVE
jgi:3-oxoacyl-(acyl-carrier-protein) synthase